VKYDQIHKNGLYFSQFSSVFDVLGCILVSKPVKVTGMCNSGMGMGGTEISMIQEGMEN
jgi:hypothetical protein